MSLLLMSSKNSQAKDLAALHSIFATKNVVYFHQPSMYHEEFQVPNTEGFLNLLIRLT